MKPLSLIIILALSFPACSHFSQTARQQRAYQKYVHKSMAMRDRQQAKAAKSRAAEIPASEAGPVTANMTAEGPQAYPREQADQ